MLRTTLFILSSGALIGLLGCAPQASETSSHQEQTGIIGGEVNKNLRLQEAVVQLVFTDGDCSGSYIGSNKILTAAHCFNSGKLKSVSFNLQNEIVTCAYVSRRIHPKYIRNVATFDLAVIKFECTPEDSIKVNQVKPLEIADKATNDEIIVLGYGMKSLSDAHNPFPELSYLTFPPLKLSKAKTLYLCVPANSKRTPYLGDSGGPTLQNNHGGDYKIIGVSSQLSAPNSDPNRIEALCFAKAFEFKKWILK